mmetsp:Transcript_101215/g.284293  ORF Transcript_101215/g.284293 Transcript_101215/m.284293 type:complete len:329 (-) Transcript_101215:117-1103(-)
MAAAGEGDAAAAPPVREATLLQLAIADALKPISHLEQAEEFDKLKFKVCTYFTKAGRSLEVASKSFIQLANDFADMAFGSIFTALGDKDWLVEVDFTVPFTAALRERFPKFANMSHFEKTAQDACDRAFDEKQSESVLWECVQMVSEQKQQRTKLYEAVNLARKTAKSSFSKNSLSTDGLETLMGGWIKNTVEQLKAATGGFPEQVVSAEVLTQFFNGIVAKNGLPRTVTAVFGAPPANWPYIQSTVAEAFNEAADDAAAALVGPSADERAAGLEAELGDRKLPPPKRSRGRAEGYGRAPPTGEQAKAWQDQISRMPARPYGISKKKW